MPMMTEAPLRSRTPIMLGLSVAIAARTTLLSGEEAKREISYAMRVAYMHVFEGSPVR